MAREKRPLSEHVKGLGIAAFELTGIFAYGFLTWAALSELDANDLVAGLGAVIVGMTFGRIHGQRAGAGLLATERMRRTLILF